MCIYFSMVLSIDDSPAGWSYFYSSNFAYTHKHTYTHNRHLGIKLITRKFYDIELNGKDTCVV